MMQWENLKNIFPFRSIVHSEHNEIFFNIFFKMPQQNNEWKLIWHFLRQRSDRSRLNSQKQIFYYRNAVAFPEYFFSNVWIKRGLALIKVFFPPSDWFMSKRIRYFSNKIKSKQMKKWTYDMEREWFINNVNDYKVSEILSNGIKRKTNKSWKFQFGIKNMYGWWKRNSHQKANWIT